LAHLVIFYVVVVIIIILILCHNELFKFFVSYMPC